MKNIDPTGNSLWSKIKKAAKKVVKTVKKVYKAAKKAVTNFFSGDNKNTTKGNSTPYKKSNSYTVATSPNRNYNFDRYTIKETIVRELCTPRMGRIVKGAKNHLEKVNLTVSNGINVSGTLGIWTYDFSIGVSFDTKDNIGLQHNFVGGVTASAKPSVAVSE